MKCDKCEKQACYHSTLVVNGEVKETHLCEACAAKEGVFTKTYNSIFDEFRSLTNFLTFDDFEDIVCPSCFGSLRGFKNSGVLGCSNCSNVFESEIKKIIDFLQPKNMDENIEFRVEPKKELTKEEKLNDLQQKLQEAIKEERYEDAGEINKQIKKLKE